MTQRKPTLFDLRAGSLDTLLLSPRTADDTALREALQRHLDASPDFFRDEAVAIDLRKLPAPAGLDVDALADWLRERGLRPLGVLGAADAVLATSLPLLHGPEARAQEARSQEARSEPAAAAPAPEATAAATPGTLLVDRPLRSGQRVYAAGDVIVLEAVSHGAEIIAGGHIHVYAALRGRALAGAHGDTSARIFCSRLEPELVAIAGVYRTAEQALPPEVAGKSAQVLLDGNQLRIEPLRGR